MDYSITSGSSAPNWYADDGVVDTSYNVDRATSTVPTDIAAQRKTVTDSPSNDGWTDYFKNLSGTVLGYAIKKDAAQTGASLAQGQRQASGRYYVAPQGQYGGQQQQQQMAIGGISLPMLLVLGAIGFAMTRKG